MPFRVEAAPLPSPLGAGEILLRVDAATICGSDLWTVSGARPTHVPITLGHEGMGTVVESARDGVVPGQRLTFSMLEACGCCQRCLGDLPQKCDDLSKYGHSDGFWKGTFATQILLGAKTRVIELGSRLPDGPAAPINCAFVTAAGINSYVEPGRIGVIGGGLVGLAVGLAVQLRFPDVPIELIEQDSARREFGKRLGLGQAPPEFDAQIECAGSISALEGSLRMLRPGGKMILAGLVHPDSKLPFTGEDLIRKCWTVIGVHNYNPSVLSDAVTLAEEFCHRLDPADWLSPAFRLDEMADALAEARSRRWLRVLLEPNAV